MRAISFRCVAASTIRQYEKAAPGKHVNTEQDIPAIIVVLLFIASTVIFYIPCEQAPFPNKCLHIKKTSSNRKRFYGTLINNSSDFLY